MITPPRDNESEICVLGSIMIDAKQIDTVATIIGPDDFFDDAHRKIFTAMLEIQKQGKPIDITLLSNELKRVGDFESVGGYATLAKLARAVPHAAHARHYAESVQGQTVRRDILRLGEEIQRLGADDSQEVRDILARVNRSTVELLEGAQRARDSNLGEAAASLGAEVLAGRYTVERGLDTHIPTLNRSGGIRPGLTTIASRTGGGKSAIILNFACHVAESTGKAVGVFSLEMLEAELSERLLAYRSDVPISEWPSINGPEARKVETAGQRLQEATILISDRPSVSAAEIAAQTRLWARQFDLGFIVVDHLGLVRPDDPRATRQAQVGAITRALKCLSMELKLPILATAQINRQAASGKPSLANLREAGDIEQDSDSVWIIWQDEEEAQAGRQNRFKPSPGVQFVQCSDRPDKVTLTVAKARGGKRGRDIPLLYWGPTFRFEEAADEEAVGEPGEDVYHNAF